MVLLVNNLGIGGAERHVVELANGLCEGFDVVVVYIKRVEHLLARLRLDRMKHVACLDAGDGFDIAAIRRLANILNDAKADVILCANEHALAYAQTARIWCRRRLRVVEIYHSTILQTWKERLKFLALQPLLWGSDALVFVCQAQRDHWRRRGVWAPHQAVIYNGVDAARFDPAPYLAGQADLRRRYGFGPDDYVIGLCAAMRPEKAHADLLTAMAQAKSEGHPWKALLIGDGPMRAQIEAEISQLGLTQDVAISGFLDDVRPEIAICDVMALVSVTEAFSVAALESMAMGKPMILSDVGGAREQVTDGHNGWIFPASNVAALAAILVAARDRRQIESRSRKSRFVVEQRFSLEAMLDAYRLLIDAKPHKSGGSSTG